jgi:hypothetical protein
MSLLRISTLLGIASVLGGCMLGTAPLLHHPNDALTLDGDWGGYSLVVQPARARIAVRSTNQPSRPAVMHAVGANTGVALAEFADWAAYVTAVAFTPRLVLAMGISDHWTVVGELGWPRQGISSSYFTRAQGRGGFRLAAGTIADIPVRELLGWAGAAWLPVLYGPLSGYVGAEAQAGRFHHIFELPPELDGIASDLDGDGLPSYRPHANLMRTELRLRLPLGLSVRADSDVSLSLAAIPYLTLAHGDLAMRDCRSCDGNVTFESLEQRWGIEIQWAARF